MAQADALAAFPITTNLSADISLHKGTMSAVIEVAPHRAELVHSKATPPPADTFLNEEDGAR